MKKPCYVEPAIGWNNEDERSGVAKYGVAHYEPLQRRAKIDAPARPALLPPPVALEQELLPMMQLLLCDCSRRLPDYSPIL